MAMEERIFSLTLLCLVLSLAAGLQVNIPKPEYEFARGDNITLPCSFTPKKPSNPLVIISWTSEKSTVPGAPELTIITHYSTGQTDVTPNYEGRASLDKDIATGKANLRLAHVTLFDNQVFECRVQIPGDDEGKLAATTRLVVLVAPSTPICKIQGKAEYGQNVNLTCKSEEGSPTPTYKWQSLDVTRAPRVPDPRTTDKGGILSLYNLTKDTSGYYTCTSSNKIRSASCNITLTVMPPSFNIGSTAGIIGGCIAALLLLVLIIYCCCCRKKKDQEEGYAMGVREEGELSDKEPMRNGERQEEMLSDVRSDDDSSVRGPSERRERDYDDRRSDYDDRRSDYDDRRSDYSDRRDRNNDRNERYDDDRRYDDERRYADGRDDRYSDRRDDRYADDARYDEPYDDRDRDRPPVPASKPPRRDYDD